MSGLFSAAFLQRSGWDADVYERSTVELVGRGAGITSHPELLEALHKCGAGTRDLGVEVDRRITLDRDGSVIGETGVPQIFTSWDRLQRLLRETIERRATILAIPSSAWSKTVRVSSCISRAAAASSPISLSAATASVPPCARRSPPRYSRSIPITIFGAARRTKPISSRKRSKPFSHTSPSSCPSDSRSSAIRSPG
jgi:hypothetical protein